MPEKGRKLKEFSKRINPTFWAVLEPVIWPLGDGVFLETVNYVMTEYFM